MKTISLKQIESVAQSLWIDHNELERAFSEHELIESVDYVTEESGGLINAFDQKGMRLYAHLMRTGWYEVMDSIYPLSQKVLGGDWQNVVDDYIKNIPPAHYYLNQLAQHFPVYLASQVHQSWPGFLLELADYEWLEFEVMVHPATVVDLQQPPPSSLDDFLTLTPLVNPTLYIRQYSFPILQIATKLENSEAAEIELQTKEPSYIAAFRPPSAKHCEFLSLSKQSAAVTEEAFARNTTYGDLAKLYINKYTPAPPEKSSLQFIEMIEYFHNNGLFIGVSNAKT